MMKIVFSRNFLFYLSFFFVVIFSVLPHSLHAQNGVSITTEEFARLSGEWDSFANSVDEDLLHQSLTGEKLNELRNLISEKRDLATKFEALNQEQIRGVQSQLDALGPVPSDDGTEPEDIAAKRSELHRKLAELKAPGTQASVFYERFNQQIIQIDRRVRANQAEQIFYVAPSLFNSKTWIDAFYDLKNHTITSADNFINLFSEPGLSSKLIKFFPLLAFIAFVSYWMIFRSMQWLVLNLPVMLRNMQQDKRDEAVHTILSLANLLAPAIGLIGIFSVALILERAGLPGHDIWISLAIIFAFIVMGQKISSHIFSRNRTFDDNKTELTQAGRAFRKLMFAAGCGIPLRYLLNSSGIEAGTMLVVGLPLFLLIIYFFIQFGKTLRQDMRLSDTSSDVAPMQKWFLRISFSALYYLPIIAGIALLFGYMNFTILILRGLMLTVLLVCIINNMVKDLSKFFQKLWPERNLVTDEGEVVDNSRAQIATLILSSALILCSIPILGLIWGMSINDLHEFGITLRDGFKIGDVRVSASNFFVFIFVFAVGFLLTRALRVVLRDGVLPKTRMDRGGQTALLTFVTYIGIFLSGLFAISATGLDLSNLALFAGALSIGIGFGMQAIVSNFVSGIILLIERPIKEGDWIEVGANSGYVRSVNVRSTKIETFDRSTIVVPNSNLISDTVLNYTLDNLHGRLILPVGVAYGSDAHQVEELLLQAAKRHPLILRVPEPQVLFVNFGASSLDFELRVFLRDVNYVMRVRSDLNHTIYKAFGENNIEIPFSQHDIHIRSNLTGDIDLESLLKKKPLPES